MPDHPAIRRCVCGHTEGDHARARGGHILTVSKGGTCLVCECDRFDWQAREDIKTLSRAALTPADEEAA